MAKLFGRAYRLQVGTVEIDARKGADKGLRIGFSISRDETRTPNNAEIRIYNLSKANAAALARLDTVPVSLEAGYVDDVGQIFLGDLRSVKTRREGPDLITTVSGGDGESRIRTARINKTFPAGTPVTLVLQGLADALGLSKGNIRSAASQLGTERLTHSRTLSGLVFDELEAFCRTRGFRWSIQDSALQVRVDGEPVQPDTGPLLRRDSGLIGEPEVERNATVSRTGKKQGTVVSGTCLLRPDLVPGSAFRVESTTHTGNLLCIESQAEGDTHGQPWYVHWTGRPYGT